MSGLSSQNWSLMMSQWSTTTSVLGFASRFILTFFCAVGERAGTTRISSDTSDGPCGVVPCVNTVTSGSVIFVDFIQRRINENVGQANLLPNQHASFSESLVNLIIINLESSEKDFVFFLGNCSLTFLVSFQKEAVGATEPTRRVACACVVVSPPSWTSAQNTVL